MPILLTFLSYSARDLATIISNSARLNKRPRLIKKNNIMLATAQFSFLESSAKASFNKKGKDRQKYRLCTKVIKS
jgi:hypothetical protein